MTTPTFSLEIEFEVEGDFSPARPATGPSYASGGDPPEDASAEFQNVVRVGVPTYDRATKAHGTRWLALTPAQIEVLSQIVGADPELKTQAEEAILSAELD